MEKNHYQYLHHHHARFHQRILPFDLFFFQAHNSINFETAVCDTPLLTALLRHHCSGNHIQSIVFLPWRKKIYLSRIILSFLVEDM